MTESSRYSRTMRVLPICAALALAALLAPSAGAATPNYRAVSQDGQAIFFTTTEKLVPGDTDTKQDVYERVYDSGLGEYVTREVSIGPVGGNDAYEAFFERISGDGKQAFFSTPRWARSTRRFGSAGTTRRRWTCYRRSPGSPTNCVGRT